LEIAGAIFYGPDASLVTQSQYQRPKRIFFNKEESKAKIQHDKRT